MIRTSGVPPLTLICSLSAKIEAVSVSMFVSAFVLAERVAPPTPTAPEVTGVARRYDIYWIWQPSLNSSITSATLSTERPLALSVSTRS